MNKGVILEALLEVMEFNLRRHHSANKSASAGATDTQSKAETKWDTCGLEASYLARGHAMQFSELATQLDALRSMPLHSYAGKPIGVGACVEVEIGEERSFYFLAHHGGGIELKLDMGMVTVITPESPLGLAVKGKRLGDAYILPSGLSGEIVAIQ